MGVETFNYIDSLNTANPTSTDNVSEGDDHIRGIKTTLKNTLPNVTGAITSTHTELNLLDGKTTLFENVVEDTTPQLGGNLDGQSYNITTTGTVSATSFTGDGSSLTGIDALPSQTGQSGNYLTTDGSTASWAALDTDANTTTKGLYEHSNTISANYSITSGNNAMSAGAITIDSGYSVTVPSGSVWTIV